jgi:peptide/nickel transport system permease protein
VSASAPRILRTILGRLVQLALVLVAISIVTFLLLNLLPGNAAANRIGPLPNFTPTERAAEIKSLEQQLGLNKPLVVQYAIWLRNAVQGNLGLNVQGEPVSQLIGGRIFPTVELAVAALLISVIVSVLLSVWALRSRFRVVKFTIQGGMATMLVAPAFWIGLVLIVIFAAQANWLPASGYISLQSSVSQNLEHLILPAITLALPLMALFFRYLSAGLEDASAQPFTVAARARGLTERAIVYRHVLPNGALPTITVVGLAIGSLMSSLVIVESVFSWPGLGSLLIQSVVTNSDYNTVVGIVLLTAATFVVVAAIVDVIYVIVDPRLRRA